MLFQLVYGEKYLTRVGTKAVFLQSFVSIVLLVYSVSLRAINTLNEGFKVLPSGKVSVQGHGTCRTFVNASATKSYFIPTKTSNEYSTFVSNKPADISYTTCRSCSEIKTNSGDYLGSGTYTIDPDGDGTGIAALSAYCDMVTDGGGWTMWFTTNQFYHLADSTTSSVAYGTAGYSVDLRSLPIKEILYVRHSDGAKDWFTRDSGTTFKVSDYISSGVLSVAGNTLGTWTGKGGASTAWSYQLVIGDKTWMQVGFMMSGYTGSCWKAPNNWCSDGSSNFYRLDGEGNGVADYSAYHGVSFRQNGHGYLSNQLMSVGVR
ncbi:MAG: hypothetical protein RJB66_1759 [Pseudomonadota bacterium]|jgi:hypothetical protein